MPERWLNDGEVFCWDVLSLKNVSSFSFILEPFVGRSEERRVGKECRL